mgnify:CR=1 FL=1
MSHDTRRLLFVKKSDAEGGDFYYLGDVQIAEEPTEGTIRNDKGELLPIVNFQFNLDEPVDTKLYEYLLEFFEDEDDYTPDDLIPSGTVYLDGQTLEVLEINC